MLTTEAKQAIIKEFAVHEGDTGSPEVQIRDFRLTALYTLLNI